MDLEAWRDASGDMGFEREFAVLAGLPPTTVVTTEDGPAPLDWLAVGDRVLTQDMGFQTIRLIERTTLFMRDLTDLPEFAPVYLKADTLASGVPARDLLVSPRQLCLTAHLDQKVLVPAQALGTQIDPALYPKRSRVEYVSLLFDNHHLIECDGMAFGSVFVADLCFGLTAPPIRSDGPMRPAAPILSHLGDKGADTGDHAGTVRHPNRPPRERKQA